MDLSGFQLILLKLQVVCYDFCWFSVSTAGGFVRISGGIDTISCGSVRISAGFVEKLGGFITI